MVKNNSTTKCPQCKEFIQYGEHFVFASGYHYHLTCAGMLIEVFQKTIDYHGGNVVAGREAVEQLRAADVAYCACKHPWLIYLCNLAWCRLCRKPLRR